jgi:hypothetical protein
MSGPGGPGSYGSTDVFARVSSHAEWITTTMAAPPAPSVELPDTPAARRLSELLEVVRASDEARSRAFVESAFAPGGRTPQERLAALGRLGHDLAGATLAGVARSQDDLLDVRLDAAMGSMILGVQVEPAPPHRIRAILVDIQGREPLSESSR